MSARLLGADAFLPIVKTGQDGAKVVHYGADQAWFKTRVGRYSGCGATAAADIFAYLAGRNPEWFGLFPHPGGELTAEVFLEHMDAVIARVPPGKLPFIDMPYTGLTSLPRFVRYCENFAASRGIPLKGRWHSDRETTFKQAVALVEEQLAQDNPVALLLMQNRKMMHVAYTDPAGQPAQTDIRFHWVVLTAIEDINGRPVVTASSEGARVSFDFADAWTGDSGSAMSWRGIVYFA